MLGLLSLVFRLTGRTKIAFLSLFLGAMAASVAAEDLDFNPQGGETVLFLGDSITHQCLYSQYLEDFFITRYPERRIRFVVSGVGGDAAGDVLARFEEDVAVYEPDYVTLLLGMNDGRYLEYDKEIFGAYQKGVLEILERIKSLDAKPIVLSATMLDHKVVEMRADDSDWRFRSKAFSPNYNALMAYFGGWSQGAAIAEGASFVGLWEPLNRHTREQRRMNPSFTLIWDAIHPQASGQMIMAFEILQQMGVERSHVDSVLLSRESGVWKGSNDRGEIRVHESEGELRFKRHSISLPWVIPEKEASLDLKWKLPSDGRLGYELCEAGTQLSREVLQVVGLSEGRYALIISGNQVGVWSEVELARGVELQSNEKTPQFQQALEVALMNQQRVDTHVRPSRDLAGKVKGARRRAAAKGEELGETELAKLWEPVYSLNREADQSLEAIYEAARPIEQDWTLRKVNRN